MANANIVMIDPEICAKCYTCVEQFGCPAIQRGAPDMAPWIHEELCNGNGSCIQVCPVDAIFRPNLRKFAARPEGEPAPAAPGPEACQ
jgi:TPP-dependent indolepyruvate ferredoxin oxidoreductase alpha subunit